MYVTRTLTKAGFLLNGEQELAGKKALVYIYQDTLTIEYAEYPLSRYSAEWQPDDKHLLCVGNHVCLTIPFKVFNNTCGNLMKWNGK